MHPNPSAIHQRAEEHGPAPRPVARQNVEVVLSNRGRLDRGVDRALRSDHHRARK